MESTQAVNVYDIPLGEIWADEDFNSREGFSLASVSSLADDIARQGLIEPIVVQRLVNAEKKTIYKVVVGHRRYSAFQLLARGDAVKYGAIRSTVLERPLAEHEALIMNLKENMEREPLNMLQEARAIRRFKQWGWDPKRVAKELGQTKKWVEIRFGLTTLPEIIQRRAESGLLNQYQVDEILGLPTAEEQYAFVRAVVDAKEHLNNLAPPKKDKKRGKKTIDVAAAGVARTPAEMFLLQESIQDSFKDNLHPAAVALCWAAGIKSYDDFVEAIEKWADDEGVTYVEHAEIIARRELPD